MHTSPSRQDDEDDDEDEDDDGDDDSDDEVSALEVPVPVPVPAVAEGVGEAVVCVAVSVASDTVEAARDPAADVAFVSGVLTPARWTARVVGVARGAVAACSRGAFVVPERAADDVFRDRCVPGVVDEAGVGSVACSSARPMTSLSGADAACVRSVDCRSIEETVRPPPTRATAVATRALRWVFLQRSRW
ncbi:hypothetical protein [Streptomyces sp. NPDC002588]|uniref:hypothetical protein n=1 Tax=Streptomyces sp. NPDC002588 TaxID=3154419 RepID=UPI003321248A